MRSQVTVTPRGGRRPRRAGALLLVAALLAALGAPPAALADSAWLTGPPAAGQPVAPWNAPGQFVPTAPPVVGVASAATAPLQVQARCGRHVRGPETPEEQQVAAAGRSIFGGAAAGWDVRVVRGTINLDEQCRPVLYQDFVFVDGVFAGTAAPQPMNAQQVGALTSLELILDDQLVAVFSRYTPGDAQGSPSGRTELDLSIARSATGPVVTPLGPPPPPGT